MRRPATPISAAPIRSAAICKHPATEETRCGRRRDHPRVRPRTPQLLRPSAAPKRGR
jgi:hypothetical protein